MPEVYKDDVKEQAPVPNQEEQLLIGRLFEYLEPTAIPWRNEYITKTLADCYNFKELRQWSGQDETLLNSLDVPAVPIDRINRGLDTIDGIRENTGSKPKFVKSELGDERIAKILDRVREHVYYSGGYREVEDQAFSNLKDVGIGISKVGYDPQGNGGQGEIWFEDCNVEDVFWKWGKRKDLSDASFFCHKQMMDWEEAMAIEPSKAPQIKFLKSVKQTEWEKISQGSVQGQSAATDYNIASGQASTPQRYLNQVDVFDFWIKRRVPVKKIGSVETVQVANPSNPEEIVSVPQPRIRIEPLEYQLQGDEQELSTTVLTKWEQYVVVAGGSKQSAILVKQGEDTDHPFVGMCAEKKKSGAPRGYIEFSIPAQRRINLAWAQKVAFNNKAIKSPIVTIGWKGKPEDVIQSSRLGSLLNFPIGTQVVSVNTVPQINMEAIEEGQIARQDMDFAAAATEAPLRGMTDSGSSGIKLSLQQNAAVTPLNKWVKASQMYQGAMAKKVLSLIIRYFKPERMMRIVGEMEFQKMVIGKLDPMTGQPLEPPLQFPIALDVADYDVIVEDQAVSDFNKQQSFNAVEALVSGGVPMDEEFRIKNAPIKNTDEAIAGYLKKRADIMNMLIAENQMLKEQMGEMQKSMPKGEGNQRSNAVRGKNEPQTGKKSMLGGQGMMAPMSR